ncbi:MAG: non-homologous end-joining DNA ligase [Actinomycetota bacterium]|nr:non-homologous end-joining DNA ligase [Actinomycetota bacterium]
MTTGVDVAVDVDGHHLRITKPDRILWPALGLTKRWMLTYYREVADVLLPHVRGHPVTLHRFPQGVTEKHWYQTRAPAHPDWVRTVTFRPERSGKVFEVVVLDGLASLLWAAQIGSIEIHPFLGTVPALERPTLVVFDLDPGPNRSLSHVAAAALLLREVLDALALEACVKTSGQKGLHVLVPLARTQPYDVTKRFARAVAALLVKEHPAELTDNMNREVRSDKVLIDWSQNDPGKSTVAPYSLRGLTIPSVSTPVTWDEVSAAAQSADPTTLQFTPSDVPARIGRDGDLLAAMADTPQVVP